MKMLNCFIVVVFFFSLYFGTLAVNEGINMQSVCYFYLLLYHSPVHSFVFLLLLLLLILLLLLLLILLLLLLLILLLLLLLIAVVCIVFYLHWPRNIV